MQTGFELPTRYFLERFGVEFDELLAPIDGAEPGGENLRGNGVYRAIQEARRQDDATLPMGPWTHELKRAEWDKVGDLAITALLDKSKDLQLVAWLLEARIARDGFTGIAPCVTLMRALCERQWEHLHPRIDGDDIEHRANVFHWMNEKLLPALRLVPLTHTSRDEKALNWADWEQAKRNEQRRAAHGDIATAEGRSTTEFAIAMAGTPTDWHREIHAQLVDALHALEELLATLDRMCGNEAPSLHQLSGLLEQIQTLVASELHKRGAKLEVGVVTAKDSSAPIVKSPATTADELTDRAAAYAKLAEVADFLQRTEPHSPVPYLLKRAISWGSLNTAELYQEVFVKFGGQISVFEMLGLNVEKD